MNHFFIAFLCAVASMVVGFVWYGPLFAKTWMRINKITVADEAARKKMQAEAGPLYAIQFVLAFFQVYVLIQFITSLYQYSALNTSLWLWVAFIMPIVAGNSMWNNDSKEVAWTRFLLGAGYQLVLFILYGIIIGLLQ